MEKDALIYVTGHSGMVGSALVAALKEQGYSNLIYRRSSELDLRDQPLVDKFFDINQPEYVFHLAARVGGILANTKYPAEFLYDNLQIQNNVIYSAHKYYVKKLLFLSSSCVYPRETQQPMKESQILTGKFEPTNEGYAVAKLAGMKLCETIKLQYRDNFISAIPPNLYGPNDNFHPQNSHVLAALLRKFILAKNRKEDFVEIWGSGTARREFLFVEDLADAMIFLMEKYNQPEPINVGSGEDIAILKLAQIIKGIVGYEGKIVLDKTKPDGMPIKLMDNSTINNLGWKNSIPLKKGIEMTYNWLMKNQEILTP